MADFNPSEHHEHGVDLTSSGPTSTSSTVTAPGAGPAVAPATAPAIPINQDHQRQQQQQPPRQLKSYCVWHQSFVSSHTSDTCEFFRYYRERGVDPNTMPLRGHGHEADRRYPVAVGHNHGGTRAPLYLSLPPAAPSHPVASSDTGFSNNPLVNPFLRPPPLDLIRNPTPAFRAELQAGAQRMTEVIAAEPGATQHTDSAPQLNAHWNNTSQPSAGSLGGQGHRRRGRGRGGHGSQNGGATLGQPGRGNPDDPRSGRRGRRGENVGATNN